MHFSSWVFNRALLAVPFQCGWSLRSSSLKRGVIRAESKLDNPWLSPIELRAWRVFMRTQMQMSYGATVTRSAF